MAKFDRSRFVSDFSSLCHSLDAPYSQEVVQQILSAYDEYLDDSYVWFRCTSKPADIVNFRLAFHGRSIPATDIAAKAGWIDIKNPLAQTIKSWSARDTAEEWCDFDPSRGVAKNWVYFVRMQPIEKIFEGLPAVVQARVPDLKAVGLEKVNFAAVDYTNRSMNVYFLLPGDLTAERAAKYVALAGSPPPKEEETNLMSSLMNPMFTFGVTLDPETGNISRVAFYATVEDGTTFGPFNERLRKFYREAPCHDEKKLHIPCWSYGRGDGKTYMKGESSYSGYDEALSRDMFMKWIEETPV